MIEIPVKDLCIVGKGSKIHIRQGDYSTLCVMGGIVSLNVPSLVFVTEENESLCKSCLREYKRRLLVFKGQ